MGPDHELRFPAVSHCLARFLQPRCQRGFGDEAISPELVEQFLLGDHPIAICREIGEYIEDLRLDRYRASGLPELVNPRVELKLAEAVNHGRIVLTRGSRCLHEEGNRECGVHRGARCFPWQPGQRAESG